MILLPMYMPTQFLPLQNSSRTKFVGLCVVTILSVMLCNERASASIITLNIGQTSGNGANYSYLHNANRSDGQDIYDANTGGQLTRLGYVQNQLSGVFDTETDILTVTGTVPSAFSHSSLTLDNGLHVYSNSLVITGGKLLINGVYGGGYLDYAVYVEGDLKTGSFYFHNEHSGIPPNSGTQDGSNIEVVEWGNNWRYNGVNWDFLELLGRSATNTAQDTTNANYYRLGIDLYGTGILLDDPVPEPTALAIWGAMGLMGLVCQRRRVRSKSRQA